MTNLIASGAGTVTVGDMTVNRLGLGAMRLTPVQVGLGWLLQHSPVMLPIPGTSKLNHLEENLAVAEVELTDEDVRELEASA